MNPADNPPQTDAPAWLILDTKGRPSALWTRSLMEIPSLPTGWSAQKSTVREATRLILEEIR
jgi:hypothetical protein